MRSANQIDQRTPAAFAATNPEVSTAQQLRAAQGAMISLVMSVARGEVRPGDKERALRILDTLGMVGS